MPIDVESDDWDSGRGYDPLEVGINVLLRQNPSKAYSLNEITTHVIENTPDALFLVEDVDEETAAEEVDDETFGQVKARVAMILESLSWRQFIDWKIVNDEEDTVGTAYFTVSDKKPISPIAEVHDVIPEKLSSIEDDIEDLEDTVKDLHHVVGRLQRENY